MSLVQQLPRIVSRRHLVLPDTRQKDVPPLEIVPWPIDSVISYTLSITKINYFLTPPSSGAEVDVGFFSFSPLVPSRMWVFSSAIFSIDIVTAS